MGRGKGGTIPTDGLMRRFGRKNNAIIRISRNYDVLSNYFLKRNLKSTAVFLDSLQTVESSLYDFRGSMVKNGLESYRLVENSILQAARIVPTKTVVCLFDTNKTPNRGKEMSYFDVNGKTGRRNGIRPMVLDELNSHEPKMTTIERNLVITNKRIPTKDEWRSMKMGKQSRKQINFYYSDVFRKKRSAWSSSSLKTRMETRNKFRGNKKKGHLVRKDDGFNVIMDNCIEKKYLLGIDPANTPHYSLECKFTGKGLKVRQQKNKASCISEGELGMMYWFYNLQYKGQHDSYLCFTTDQDIIPISILGTSSKSNVFLCLPKNKKIDGEKKKFWLIIDVDSLKRNIIDAYVGLNIKYPIFSEMFLFLMGGGDYFDKPFHGIGYKVIYETYEKNIKKFGNMLSLATITMDGHWLHKHAGYGDEVDINLIRVDKNKFRKFTKKLFFRKYKRGPLERFSNVDNEGLYVMPRQFSFYTLYLMNTNTIRMKYGYCPVFDPLSKTPHNKSVWGYEEGNMPNCFINPVCKDSEKVCDDSFIYT